jgi:ubiquinone/menaquinone biosynthesis C-methylase UbiE
VTGIDLIPEMLERAKTNLEKTSLKNVTFQQGSAEQLPFRDGTLDVVISNGAFNLIPDKRRALREVFRVLKSSGRLLLADQILMRHVPADTESMVENWAR